MYMRQEMLKMRVSLFDQMRYQIVPSELERQKIDRRKVFDWNLRKKVLYSSVAQTFATYHFPFLENFP